MSCFYFSKLFPSNAILSSTMAKIFLSSKLTNCLIIAKEKKLEIHDFSTNESFEIILSSRIFAVHNIKTNEENDDWILLLREDRFCEICKIDKNKNLLIFKRVLLNFGEQKEGLNNLNQNHIEKRG